LDQMRMCDYQIIIIWSCFLHQEIEWGQVRQLTSQEHILLKVFQAHNTTFFCVLSQTRICLWRKMAISPIRQWQKWAMDMTWCPISSNMHSNMLHSLRNEVPSMQSGKVSSSV
jgi:hypothetical protein